jgi:hypothetical protein
LLVDKLAQVLPHARHAFVREPEIVDYKRDRAMRLVRIYARIWGGIGVVLRRRRGRTRAGNVRDKSKARDRLFVTIFENLEVVCSQVRNRLSVFSDDYVHLNEVGGDLDDVIFVIDRLLGLGRFILERWFVLGQRG